MNKTTIYEHLAHIFAIGVIQGRAIDPHTAIALAESITNLDSWLLQGGFVPFRWERMGVVIKEDKKKT